jgi:hypothetical protein
VLCAGGIQVLPTTTGSMFDITGAELLVIFGAATFVLGRCGCLFDGNMRALGYSIRSSEDTAPFSLEIDVSSWARLLRNSHWNRASLSCGSTYA